jgi:hypothetical protein
MENFMPWQQFPCRCTVLWLLMTCSRCNFDKRRVAALAALAACAIYLGSGSWPRLRADDC